MIVYLSKWYTRAGLPYRPCNTDGFNGEAPGHRGSATMKLARYLAGLNQARSDS